MKVLTGVRHVPDLLRNLISLRVLDESGYICKTENGTIKISKESYVAMKGVRSNGLYFLLSKTEIGISVAATAETDPIDQTMLWHRRLGHISEKGLYYLNKEKVFGKDIISKVDFCENCIFGKQHRLSFNLRTHKAKNILDYVHVDL